MRPPGGGTVGLCASGQLYGFNDQHQKHIFVYFFYKFLYDNNHVDTLVNQTTNLELGKQVLQRRLPRYSCDNTLKATYHMFQ